MNFSDGVLRQERALTKCHRVSARRKIFNRVFTVGVGNHLAPTFVSKGTKDRYRDVRQAGSRGRLATDLGARCRATPVGPEGRW